MNTKKIRFDYSDVAVEIEVQGCYPYLINPTQNKVVLRITANEADTDFDTLHELKENETGIIKYYERIIDESGDEPIVGEWVLKNTYENYDSGEISIDYENGQYRAEVTRVDGMVKEVAKIKADVDYIATMADIPLGE